MLGGSLALDGHGVAGLGDLVLAHLEEHLRGLELVVLARLLADDDVTDAVAAGELLGGVGVEEGGERDQLGVALGVHVGDGAGDLLALGVAVDLALREGGLGGGELRLGRDQLGLHLRVALGGDLHLAARRGEPGLGDTELLLGGLEAGRCLAQLGTGLVEVLVGALELALDLVLLVLEVVGMSSGHTQRHDCNESCSHRAMSGTGEGTHRGSLCVGEAGKGVLPTPGRSDA